MVCNHMYAGKFGNVPYIALCIRYATKTTITPCAPLVSRQYNVWFGTYERNNNINVCCSVFTRSHSPKVNAAFKYYKERVKKTNSVVSVAPTKAFCFSIFVVAAILGNSDV